MSVIAVMQLTVHKTCEIAENNICVDGWPPRGITWDYHTIRGWEWASGGTWWMYNDCIRAWYTPIRRLHRRSDISGISDWLKYFRMNFSKKTMQCAYRWDQGKSCWRDGKAVTLTVQSSQSSKYSFSLATVKWGVGLGPSMTPFWSLTMIQHRFEQHPTHLEADIVNYDTSPIHDLSSDSRARSLVQMQLIVHTFVVSSSLS